MARVIQEHIKKPLADEVLFGKLKGGGHVRVVLVKDEASTGSEQEKIGFEYVEGPVTPKPEKLPGARKRTCRASRNRVVPAAGRRARPHEVRWSRSEPPILRTLKSRRVARPPAF